jgi:glutathione S-transferase
LHEKKVPFELVPVDLSKGEHKTPEYLAKHPYGQIPYIVCGFCSAIETAIIILVAP